MDKKQIWSIVRQRDFSITDADVDLKTEVIYDDILQGKYDFSRYRRNTFTQQGKKRVVYSYPKFSVEDILCQYLKKQIDIIFKIRYASRSRIINLLFNILPVVKDMNDFVIIRADFKSFFDSMLAKHVYEKYMRESLMSRAEVYKGEREHWKTYDSSIEELYCSPVGHDALARVLLQTVCF